MTGSSSGLFHGAVMKNPAEVDDEDVDTFIAKYRTKMNPALSAEERADGFHDFAIGIVASTEPERSKEWAQELARKVRAKVLWLKSSS